MKKMFSAFLMLCLLLSCSCAAFADQTYRIPVCELYSVDGYYEDGAGNASRYSYHVPLIHASTADAKAIWFFGRTVASRFGTKVVESATLDYSVEVLLRRFFGVCLSSKFTIFYYAAV